MTVVSLTQNFNGGSALVLPVQVSRYDPDVAAIFNWALVHAQCVQRLVTFDRVLFIVIYYLMCVVEPVHFTKRVYSNW